MRNLIPLLLVLLLSGCDSKRIAALEKENRDLKAKLDAVLVIVPLELQGKCSRQATLYFINEGYAKRRSAARSGDTVDLTSHYIAQSGKCVGQISQLTFFPAAIMHQRILFDAYEGKLYGVLAWEASRKDADNQKLSGCVVIDLAGVKNKCNSTKEFEELAKKLYGL